MPPSLADTSFVVTITINYKTETHIAGTVRFVGHAMPNAKNTRRNISMPAHQTTVLYLQGRKKRRIDKKQKGSRKNGKEKKGRQVQQWYIMVRLAVTLQGFPPPSTGHHRSAVHDVLAQKTFAGPCRQDTTSTLHGREDPMLHGGGCPPSRGVAQQEGHSSSAL